MKRYDIIISPEDEADVKIEEWHAGRWVRHDDPELQELRERAIFAEQLRKELVRIREMDAKAFANWQKEREVLHDRIDELREKAGWFDKITHLAALLNKEGISLLMVQEWKEKAEKWDSINAAWGEEIAAIREKANQLDSLLDLCEVVEKCKYYEKGCTELSPLNQCPNRCHGTGTIVRRTTVEEFFAALPAMLMTSLAISEEAILRLKKG